MSPKRGRALKVVVGVGLVAGGALIYGPYARRTSQDGNPSPRLLSDPALAVLRTLPLRIISRAWGWVNSLSIPGPLREPVYEGWCSAFNCDVKEASQALKEYKNLGEFFSRSLEPNARPLDMEGVISSPADGLVISCGPVEAFGTVEQVKGVKYRLRELLGAGELEPLSISSVDVDPTKMVEADDKQLFYVTIYLAPGDYHNFHSPVDGWVVKKRRHIAGELLSVRPSFAARVPGLFTLNERVVLLGEWAHGLFTMTAVGAMNVGSVAIQFDNELKTNRSRDLFSAIHEKTFRRPGVKLTRGQKVGGFRLGSTIVLIFEAPSSFKFSIQAGDTLRCGKSIGALKEAVSSSQKATKSAGWYSIITGKS